MKARVIAAAALAAGLIVACTGVPKSIPDNLSAREIIQRAQEANDAYKYEAAIVYYQALRDRFGSDPGFKAEADYEMSFIAYKQGRVPEAKKGLEELLASYEGPEGASLPKAYQILAKKVLDAIAEKSKTVQ
jgi:outer membrane protein assembly factor BamD (BamD/ComL family)